MKFLRIIEYIFADQDINLQAIRSLRVLRPLRAINRISSLRLLVTLILDILPMLGNGDNYFLIFWKINKIFFCTILVMIFCLFLFFVSGIIAVQLWAGVLRQRCFFPTAIVGTADGPPDYLPPYYTLSHEDYVCSPIFGMRHCSQIPLYE